MKKSSSFFLICLSFFLFLIGCKEDKQSEWGKIIDKINQEAFDYRYINIDSSKIKADLVLRLINAHDSTYYSGKAKAWNTLAYANFLTSDFILADSCINEIKKISQNYDTKTMEEAISYMIKARMLLRECKYVEAFKIYDDSITIFRNKFSLSRTKRFFSKNKYDEKRFYWAESEYLIGNAILNYYYRDSDPNEVLKYLQLAEKNFQSKIDATQLSYLYYTFTGAYEQSIKFDPKYLDSAFVYVNKGLNLLSDESNHNNYFLANNYQIMGEILVNDSTISYIQRDSLKEMFNKRMDFIKNLLKTKYKWTDSEIHTDSLPLIFFKKTDTLFYGYNDPYQNMASNRLIGKYYLDHKDTCIAQDYFNKSIVCDSILRVKGSHALKWKKEVYNDLLHSLNSNENTVDQAKIWYKIYSTESDIIAKNKEGDYNAQKSKIKAESDNKRYRSVTWGSVLVFIVFSILIYWLINRIRRSKDSQSDLELLSKIGKQIVSKLEISDDIKRCEFVNEIYNHIRRLKVLSKLHDFSFILYIKDENNELQRYCKEDDKSSEVNTSILSLERDSDKPAVLCYLKYDREVLCFNNWDKEYKVFAKKMNIDNDKININTNTPISGLLTNSLAFINLYNKKGDKIGVLSFQTTKKNTFKNPLILAIFEIIAEYIASALDNAMQYETLHYMQQQLIEQKRMELLTYVVRGISHELSQPLFTITQTLKNASEIVDKVKSNGEEQTLEEFNAQMDMIVADLEMMLYSKNAMSDLINSFRNIIKENIVDPETEFNLNERIEDVIKIMKPSIKSNINLMIECAGNIVIRSFPLLMGQILTNLISNANQHAFPNDNDYNNTIRIICKTSRNDLIIQCIDNGIGIPEDKLDKLCQPFVSSSKEKSNLGLGLFLIKNIVVQYMNGQIVFSSDKGFSVTIIIPNCVIL